MPSPSIAHTKRSVTSGTATRAVSTSPCGGGPRRIQASALTLTQLASSRQCLADTLGPAEPAVISRTRLRLPRDRGHAGRQDGHTKAVDSLLQPDPVLGLSCG